MISKAFKLSYASWLAIVLTGGFISGGVCAADEEAYFSELPIVASVSRLPQRLADAPTAVTVIDREMLRKMPIRDLNDVFRLVPGFQTYPNNTDAGRVTYHGMIDDIYAPRVQVLVDGRSMYSPLFGGSVNWLALPVMLDDIERIEIVRGTNAVSYGSNAYLGVINIITLDPAVSRGISVSSSYGNQNVRDYGVRIGGRIGEVGDYRVTYRSMADDGLTNRDDWADSYNKQLFDLRADLSLSERDTLQVGLGKAEGKNYIGSLLKPLDPHRQLQQSDSYFQLLYRHAASATSEFEARYAFTEDRSEDPFAVDLGVLNPSSAGMSVAINQSGDKGTRHEIELQRRDAILGNSRMVVGVAWQYDQLHSNWFFPGQGAVKRENFRLFSNVEWKPFAWFTGNVGLAAEQDSFAGFHLLPRLSGNFHFDSENTLRAGIARATRSASMAAYRGAAIIDQPDVFYRYRYVGNSELPVERLDTVEIGYLGDWRAWQSSLDVRLYRENIKGRLYRVNEKLTGAVYADDTLAYLVPLQNVQIHGLEYQFKWQPFDSTRLMLNQSFSKVDAEFLASSQSQSAGLDRFTEMSVPRRTTSVLWLQRLPFKIELSTAYYRMSEMKWSTNTSSPLYERVDVKLAYPFRFGGVGGEVAVTVQSLNGEHVEYKQTTGKPDGRIVGRRQWVSLCLDF